MKELPVLLCFALVVGCGSSVERTREQSGPPVTAAGDDAGATPEAPVRTLKTAKLLPGSPQNLLIDVTFRTQGWGQFMTVFDGSFSQVTIPIRTFSTAPKSVSAPVAILKDPAATDAKSKSVLALASFLGGKGPFVASVWVSRANVAGDPMDLEDDPLVFRASVTASASSTSKAYDLGRQESVTIAKRTWWRFEARIDADLPTAFFQIKGTRKGGAVWVTAPEVVPLAAMDAGATTKSLTTFASPRPLLPEEIGAMAAYAKQPLQLGLPKLPKMVPGKTIPLD